MKMTLQQLGQLYIYTGAAIIVVAGIFFNSLKKSNLVTLPLYILVITLLNMYAETLPNNTPGYRSFFNWLVIPLEFLYFFGLYLAFTQNQKIKKLIVALAAIYIASFFVDLLIFKKEYGFLYRRSYMVGTIVLLILVVTYFYELLNSERLFTFYRVPEFWISTGVLLFYIGTLPFHSFLNTAAKNEFINAFYSNKYNFYILLYLMHLCFIIGIICLRWKKK
jgi:hypothetical protein